LTTQWPKEEGQTIQWPKERQTAQWPKEGQTIQWPKEGQTMVKRRRTEGQTMIYKTLSNTTRDNTDKISIGLKSTI
jgi:hypothetical protein